MTEPRNPDPLLRVIRRSLRFLGAATVLFYLVLGWVAWQNTSALCTLRGDLETRVASSKKFLEEHPNGIDGISARDIQTGIDNQERTIDALGGLTCL